METEGRTLKVTDLCKAFDAQQVLDGVSLSVEPGQIVGLVGANGVGKTTTMQIIMGMVEADSGTVSFGDSPIDASARDAMGFMPEGKGRFADMKASERLEYFAGLHEAVALVFDEPFLGLQPESVEVMDALLHVWAARGVPVLFSTSDLDLAQSVCTHVAVLSKGSIVRSGSVDSIRRDSMSPRVKLSGDERAVRAGESRARELNQSVQELPDGIIIETGPQNLAARKVLQAAVGAGVVTEFTPMLPNLSDIFRRAMAAGAK